MQPSANTRPAITLGVAAFLAIYAGLAIAAAGATGWPPIYPLDDTYTQMSLARTLAESGTFGFIEGIPAFSSSSPIWVLALAAASFAMPMAFAPALLNVICGILLIVTGVRYLAGRGMSTRHLIAAAIALVTIPALPAVAAIGLEHVAHAWLSLLFAGAVVAVAGGATRGRSQLWLLPLAALLTGCRFEGFFLVAAASLLLARRRLMLSVAIVAAAFLPLAIHATFSVRAGWYPLPATLVIKGNYPAERSVSGVTTAAGTRAVRIVDIARTGSREFRVVGLAAVTAVNLLGLAWALRRRHFPPADVRMSLLFVGALTFHALLAKLDRTFGRYEMYLVVLGLTSAIPWAAAAIRHTRQAGLTGMRKTLVYGLAALLSVAIGFAILSRSLQVMQRARAGSNEIFLQQYQMARFAASAYAGQSVVINDLGLMTFAGRVNPIDIAGLGTIEIARLITARSMSPKAVDDLARARGAQLAIVYPSWLERLAGGIPQGWVPVAELVAPPTEVAAHRAVTFYAVSPAHAPRLREELRSFEPSLPAASRLVWID